MSLFVCHDLEDSSSTKLNSITQDIVELSIQDIVIRAMSYWERMCSLVKTLEAAAQTNYHVLQSLYVLVQIVML